MKEILKDIPIDDLIPYDKNYLNHDNNREFIKNSIGTFDFTTPIEVDENMIILAGHGRLEAAKILNMETIPFVLKISGWDDKKKTAYRYANNASASKAEIIYDNVELDLDIIDGDYDLGDFGFDMNVKQLQDEVIEDEAPPVPEIPKTVKGDIYELGNHRVMCGDSTVITDVEKLMDGQKADMVFTDPPYGINEKGDRTKRNGKNSLRAGVKYDDFKDDSIQYAVDAYNLCEGLGIPRQVWWGANYYCHSLPQSNNWFIWDKRVEEKQKDLNSDCEMAWVKSEFSSIRIFRHLWKGLIKGSENGIARVHPTQKPIALAQWSFDYFKNVASVLDLFLGSGSTLIACEQTNRKCYGMELDEKYCDVIVQRYVNFTGNTKIKLNDQEIEWSKSDG